MTSSKKLKKQKWLPEESFTKEQRAYFQDLLTSYIIRIRVIEKQCHELKEDLKNRLFEIRRIGEE